MQTASSALSSKLKELEAQQVGLEAQIQEVHRQMQVECPSIELMGAAFARAKQMLCSGELSCVRRVIEQYVDGVVLWPEMVEIHIHLNQYAQVITLPRESLQEGC